MSRVRADRSGVWLPADAVGPCAAVFDGVTVWRFDAPGRDEGGEELVEWPAAMLPWLEGWSHLEIRTTDTVLDAGEVRFGEGEQRVSFVDEHGLPVVVDKWGLTQRPFAGRGSEVTSFLAEVAREIVDVVARDCGVHLWMAFGTLLGAMRDGKPIAHDSDVDLAYLSDKETPARMTLELYGIKRALVQAGFQVINKTGSFLTVSTMAPDGSPATLDVYTCFHLAGKFYATATLRTELPREAILPLGEAPFEDQVLPVPADPDRVLAASYGPRWRTPDPGFTHEPGPEVVDRFEGWFGNLMRQRRDWEIYWRGNWRPEHDDPTAFTAWVLDQAPAGATVVDLGCGRGQSSLAMAAAGHPVWAFDYARDAVGMLRDEAARQGVELETRKVNLYDTRDALAAGALVAATGPGPRVVHARHVLEAVPPYARANLWLLARMLLRAGGRMYIEVDEVPQPPGAPVNHFPGRAGRVWPVRVDALAREWHEAGATEVRRERVEVPRSDRAVTRWRIVLAWNSR